MFYFKNVPLKRKTYLQRNKKTKMEDNGGELIFSEGRLQMNAENCDHSWPWSMSVLCYFYLLIKTDYSIIGLYNCDMFGRPSI